MPHDGVNTGQRICFMELDYRVRTLRHSPVASSAIREYTHAVVASQFHDTIIRDDGAILTERNKTILEPFASLHWNRTDSDGPKKTYYKYFRCRSVGPVETVNSQESAKLDTHLD